MLHKFPSAACLWSLLEASLCYECYLFNLLTLDLSAVLSGSGTLLELLQKLGRVLRYNGKINLYVFHPLCYVCVWSRRCLASHVLNLVVIRQCGAPNCSERNCLCFSTSCPLEIMLVLLINIKMDEKILMKSSDQGTLQLMAMSTLMQERLWRKHNPVRR